MRLLGLIVWCATLSPGAALAATVVVTDLGDGPGVCPGASCTLRAALAAAQASDTIVFDASLAYPSSLILAGTELSLTRDVSVIGPGPDRLTISAGAQSRVLQVLSGSVRLRGLALSSGRRLTADGVDGTPGTGAPGQSASPAEGGCVLVAANASLQLERVALVSCQARGGNGGDGASGSTGILGGMGGAGGQGGAARGAAIASYGSLTLIDSSVQGALALGGNGGRGGDGGAASMPGGLQGMAGPAGSGGAAQGAALYLGAGAALLMRNSTLVAGTATGGTGGGGGVSSGLSTTGGNGGSAEGGGAYLSANLTLADVEFASLGYATMQAGAGGPGGGGAPAGNTGLARGETVFAGSAPRVRHVAFVGLDDATDCHGSLTASGTNLASDASCGFALQSSFAQTFAGPAVDEVAGRAVLRPLTGSAVIDAASNCADLDGALVTNDGVGRPRPQDGDGAGPTLCDLGAFEAGPHLFRDGFEL